MELKEFTFVEDEGTTWEGTTTSAVLYVPDGEYSVERYVLHAEEATYSFIVYPEEIDRAIEMLEWCKAHRDGMKAPALTAASEAVVDDPNPVEEDG